MRSRVKRSITWVMGVIAVIGVTLLITVYHPHKMREDAKSDVLAWEEHWLAARDCILGPKPAASTAGESLTIRELEGSADLWKCKPLTQNLSRAISEDTGLDDIEAAWPAVNAASTKLTTLYAIHLSDNKHDGKLAQAMDNLERARAGLRGAAGLPPPDALGPKLASAELVAVADAGQPVTELDKLMPSAHGAVAYGSTKTGQVEVVLTSGGAPTVARVAAGQIRSTVDPTFAAIAGAGGLQVGSVDAHGELVGDKQVLPMQGRVSVLLAQGSAATSVVVYGVDDMVIARKAAGAKELVADKPIPITTVVSAVDPVTNRSALAWLDKDGKLFGTFVWPVAPASAAPPAPLELGIVGEPKAMCLTADRAYVLTSTNMLVPFTPTGLAPSLVVEGDLRGCSPNAVIIERRSKFSVCTETCRETNLKGPQNTRMAVVMNGKLVALSARDGVIGVFRDDRAPSYLAAKVTSLVGAMTDGKVIDAIARTSDGIAIVRIAQP